MWVIDLPDKFQSTDDLANGKRILMAVRKASVPEPRGSESEEIVVLREDHPDLGQPTRRPRQNLAEL
jgi:hypothetical protein